VGSLISISNCLGRVVQGASADKVGFKKVLTTMAVLQAGLLYTLTLVAGHKALFTLWVCLIAFMYGGNFALYPTASMDQFGKTYAGSNYGVIFTAYAVAGVVGALLKGDLEKAVGGFEHLTFLLGGVCTTGALLTFFVKPKMQ